MKVLNRSAFMALPAGVIFCKGTVDQDGWLVHSWQEPMVKDDTLPAEEGRAFSDGSGDFLYRDLIGIAGNDPTDIDLTVTTMLRDGSSRPLSNSGARDGSFNPLDVFLVYEASDLARLAEAVTEALRVTKL